jgi:hypothetical protein
VENFEVGVETKLGKGCELGAVDVLQSWQFKAAGDVRAAIAI